MAMTMMIAATFLSSISATDPQISADVVLAEAPVAAQAQTAGGNVKPRVRGRRCPEASEEEEEQEIDDQSVRGRKCKGGPGQQGK